MKRNISFITIGILVIGGIYWFWQRQTQPIVGTEVDLQDVAGITLQVPYVPLLAGEPLGPNNPAWQVVPSVTVPLVPQVMFIPWGAPGEREVEVRAMHDGEAIQFQLSWADATRDNLLVKGTQFPDGAAIMFPIEKASAASIMMGFMDPVNIWHWKASRRVQPAAKVYSDFHIPYEQGTLLGTHREDSLVVPPGSEIVDNAAKMPGSLTPKQVQSVFGTSRWVKGRWFVTFRRKLATPREVDSQFTAGKAMSAAFAVWDGAKKERGSRKANSDWIHLVLEKENPS